MKILYITSDISLPSEHGGSSHVTGISESLRDLGHEVTIALKKEKGQKFKEKIEGINYIRFPILPTKIGKLISHFFTSIIASTFIKYDILYERARIFGGSGCIISNLKKKKCLYELNEPYPEILLLEKNFSRLTYKLISKFHYFVLKKATLVLGSHKSFFKNYKGQNTKVLLWGVNPKKFLPKKGKRSNSLLYIGSFAKWHALDEILDATKIALNKNKKIKLILIGEGEKYNQIKERVKKEELNKSVTLTGKIEYKKIQNFVRDSTICLALFDRNYPHFKELDYFYTPLKVQEYKACEKPVIGSDIGNLKIIIPQNKGGFLVNEKKPIEIAKAILKLINSPKTMGKMGKFNRKDAIEKYSWDQVNKQILKSLRP